jgi:hypothetical protein
MNCHSKVLVKNTFVHLEEAKSCTRPRAGSDPLSERDSVSQCRRVDVVDEGTFDYLGKASKEDDFFCDGGSNVSRETGTPSELDDLSESSLDDVADGHSWLQSGGFSSLQSPELRTTVMLKNIPNDYSRDQLVSLLQIEGFACRFDFLYMPLDFTTHSAFGYAFINFVSAMDAHQFQQQFHHFSNWSYRSKKVAEVTWSKPTQGLDMNIERYRNSSVMHNDVPDKFKPTVFHSGHRMQFPYPTKVLAFPDLKICAEVGQSERTTVMIRNIPNDYTRDMMIELLAEKGFERQINFLYLPMDFQKWCGLGYAFVNLVSDDCAQQLMNELGGFDAWKVPSRKVATVVWSRPSQGYDAQVERYRNSPIMHESVDDRFKPVLFHEGRLVQFPPPTRALCPPRRHE